MYKIYLENYPIYDLRDDEYIVSEPNLRLEVNKLGSLTFNIREEHPYYDNLIKRKSVLSVYKADKVIYKGYIITDEQGMFNDKKVECEGVLGYLNDSIVRPYSFSGTPEEHFINLFNNHNSQVTEEQQLKIGMITVTDPNNYITRSSIDYASTWDVLNDDLISRLGGYLRVRYEEDGTYVDYLEDFDDTSTQVIEFGENLIDVLVKNDAADIYTVVIPLGAEKENEDGTTERLTIRSVNNDLDYIVNQEAFEQYGWIVAPVENTTWEDVTVAANLKTKGTEYLNNEAVMLKSTLEISAIDLNATDEQIEAFFIYEYVRFISPVHNMNERYLLQQIDIPMDSPQDMKITLGKETSSLTGIQISGGLKGPQGEPGTPGKSAYQIWLDQGNVGTEEDYLASLKGADGKGVNILGSYNSLEQLEAAHPTGNVGDAYLIQGSLYVWNVEANAWENVGNIQGPQGIPGPAGANGESTYFHVRYSANANGNPMTNAPTSATKYMGVASTTSSTAPTSYSDYTWTLIKGSDGTQGSPGPAGADGVSSYLHIKYSDDGTTFTANSGETVGRYRGELVDTNPTDSEVFSDYTWYDMALIVEDELNSIRVEMQTNMTSIQQSMEEITMTALQDYVAKSDFETYQEQVSTEFTQTAEDFNFQFNNITSQITTIDGNTQQQFQEINKYIRFVDGNIILGESGNEITLKIENDRIAFIQNNNEVAYFSNNKLTVLDGDFLNSLKIGNFAFKPRANGNLSLVYVGGEQV